jgi:CRP-like cAMP-binding protein
LGIGSTVIILACLPVLINTDHRTAERAAALEPVVALLRELDLFDGADRTVLERLAIAAVPETVPAGTVLIGEGDPAEDIWLLADGQLDVSTRAIGPLPAVTAPGYVGEIGVLHERPRTATVTTASECRLYRLAGTDFRNTLTAGSASSSLLRLSGLRLARTDIRRPEPRQQPYAPR